MLHAFTIGSTWPAHIGGFERLRLPDGHQVETGDLLELFDPQLTFTQHEVLARRGNVVRVGPAIPRERRTG